jgi:hypothetical protein
MIKFNFEISNYIIIIFHFIFIPIILIKILLNHYFFLCDLHLKWIIMLHKFYLNLFRCFKNYYPNFCFMFVFSIHQEPIFEDPKGRFQ